MLSAKAGADILTISAKLGWQVHTARAAITGLRKDPGPVSGCLCGLVPVQPQADHWADPAPYLVTGQALAGLVCLRGRAGDQPVLLGPVRGQGEAQALCGSDRQGSGNPAQKV
ncbi:DUF3489 domain-containing protein [Marivita geojedonensis]|nr:DUF3489 domain-containing protein [Marivita geojedonensis]